MRRCLLPLSPRSIFLILGKCQLPLLPFARQDCSRHDKKGILVQVVVCEVVIFSEIILGHVEFLNVNENTPFGSLEISSWYHAAPQNIRKNKKAEITSENKITTSKDLFRITGKVVTQATEEGEGCL